MRLNVIVVLLLLFCAWGTFALAQSTNVQPEIAPGIAIPETGVAWALDTIDGKPALAQIQHHQVRVNNHTGANLVNVIPGTSDKTSIDVDAPHAAVQLHSNAAVFLMRAYAGEEGTAPAHPESECHLIRLQSHGKRRVVHNFEYSLFKGKPKRMDDVVAAHVALVPGTWWIKLVPAQPLPPGEYALEDTQTDPSAYTKIIYDFGIAESATGPGVPATQGVN